MQKLIAAWREIVSDFSWPVLILFTVYSAVSIVMNAQSPNVEMLPGTVKSLIRLVCWLTIIAIMVPRQSIPVPVRRPVQELAFFIIWGIVDFFLTMSFWGLLSSHSPYVMVVYLPILFGRPALAILFARIFRYSASDLGIPFKHWRLYLGLLILAFLIGSIGQVFEMLSGVVYLLVLFILYLSNRKRWQGLVDDLKSLRPYALPILLCAFVTSGLQWVQYKDSSLLWLLPLRIFQVPVIFQAAMPEEFFFRLGLQTRLASFLPFGWASLFQGIAFDVFHIPQGLSLGYIKLADIPWSFTDGIANALAGGYFWHRSKNLPATILFHVAAFI